MADHRSERLKRCGEGGSSQWSAIVALAKDEGVVNLGQGSPDTAGDDLTRQAAVELLSCEDATLATAYNQYSPMQGVPELRQAIVDWNSTMYDCNYNPETEVLVATSGTEALYNIMMALVNPNDHVIVFEPFFPWYLPHLKMAGANVEILTITPPSFALPLDDLANAMTSATKMVVFNTPHNPTGHVATEQELAKLAELCIKHDVIAVADEVYENIIFAPHRHRRLADQPGMADRTLTVGSASKLLALTGWRIGWVLGNEALLKPVKAYHAYTTFAAPTPLQYAVAKGIDNLIGNTDLRQSEAKLYEQNAQRLGTALEEVLGVTIYWPQGGYFLVADVSSTGKLGMAFAEWLVLRYKIACVPMAVFYSPETGKSFEHLVRFAVCKTEATIAKACARLKQGEIE